ncbi:uncharacterized protein FIESC28_07696 [Fusarium coffeatum]|uniref:Xylanolytic transcriptional activator regulatory domain-containing protein n=1 Tax=Fusarium coffeatum TaxID=231269 RepID=A0A366RDS9_9HYPO|nr:uncharacterized protein FIESC28_07696 [Fusarium coffeatum]RBR14460.1 hypothetical protein FIESC28_07696 [Fusarium coffeatum]
MRLLQAPWVDLSAGTSPQNTDPLLSGLGELVWGSSHSSPTQDPDLHFHQSYLQGLQLLNGLPFFSEQGQKWMAQTVAESTLTNSITERFQQDPLPRTQSSPPNRIHLPPYHAVERFATRFCSSAEYLVFPVLSHQRLLNKTLPLACSNGQSGTSSARACVLAMLVTGDVHGQDPIADGAQPIEKYVADVEESLSGILREATLDGLEALTMLIIYKYFIGDLDSASFLISMAGRMIFQHGAFMPPPHNEPYNKDNPAHHMRDLFWVCYCIDKDLCHRIGQPPSINDAHCDLTLPPNYAEMQNSNILSIGHASIYEPTTVPLYPWDLRLSIIKSRIYEDLYSMSAASQPEAEILRRIRYLDEELEVWRLTLAPDHRPTLSFLDKTPLDANTNTQAIMLRLSYHHCVILIHKARCRILGPMSSLVGDGHEANFQLLVDASKSILTYLEKALPAVAHECFWIIIFYPMTAIFTVFSIALLNTQTGYLPINLSLLQDFTRVIKQIPIRKLTVAEVSHLAFIQELVEEMSRLMVAAAQKAGVQ